MPLYEYECEQNKHRFEVIQKFSDPPVETCPTCGSPVHKLIASPAIQFKGSGWYITDYAKKDSQPKTPASDAKKDAPAASSSDSSAGRTASTDTKSAPTPSTTKTD